MASTTESDADVHPYPAQWEADVVLRDGSVAHMRPITPEDAAGVQAMHDNQSEESIYLRFFAPIKHLAERDLYRFTHVDHDQRVALVALVRDEIIGIARFDRLDDPTIAEVAFNISDHYHGRGVGSVMLEHLAAIGRECGVLRFVAEVLPQNQKMMSVFTDAGYEVDHHFDDGVISVAFRIEDTARSQAVSLAREHRAEGQSIRALLTPAAIAVVGVSRRPDSLGSIVLDNLLDGDYQGVVYVVNSEVDTIRGLKAYKKVSDIGQPVDMAIIAVPAEHILDIVDDCAVAGVRGIVVFSSGFAEAGPHGEARQAGLLQRARAAGMRVVGPTSFGLINNHAEVRLSAVLARHVPKGGGIGLFTQSGGLGVALLEEASKRNLGVSVFASAGNRVDVSGNDLMQYWIDDDETEVVCMYLESVGNPRKFSRIARQLSLRKPVIVVKSPTTGVVPPGHRARETRVPAIAFTSLLDQAGAIKAANVHELVDIARMAIGQPLPSGNRIAIVGNTAGTNAVIASTAEQSGLVVTRGPKNLPILATIDTVSSAMQGAFADTAVDAVITCFMPPMRCSDRDIARAIAHASWGHNKPCSATFLGMDNVSDVVRRAGEHVDGRRRVIPVYGTPLCGVRALSAMTGYAAWRRSDHGERVHPEGIDQLAADRTVERILQESPQGHRLDYDEAKELLATYGIDLWSIIPVHSEDEAVEAAGKLGYPVVVRSMADAALHLPGAVKHDLHDPEDVRRAFTALVDWLGPTVTKHLAVQRMATPAMATVIRSTEDPLFGPVVSFGLVGAVSEDLGDISYRIPPLTNRQISDMIDSLATAKYLLKGHKHFAAADRGPIEDLLARVSVLADEVPDIASLELNPVNVHPHGVEVLGAVIHLAPASARTDAGRRALA